VDAVAALNAARTPAAFRGGTELPVGRGYIVRSGQTTMIQIADPYVGAEVSSNGHGPGANGFGGNGTSGLAAHHSPTTNGHLDDDDDPEDASAIALDAWVERLVAKYTGYQPGWLEAVDEPEVETEKPLTPQQERMIDLVKRAGGWERGQIEANPDLVPTVQPKLDAFTDETWRDENALLDVLRAAMHRNLASVLGEDMATAMVGAMYPDDLMNQLEGILPKEEASGVVS
jgi:hypothetical protein